MTMLIKNKINANEVIVLEKAIKGGGYVYIGAYVHVEDEEQPALALFTDAELVRAINRGAVAKLPSPVAPYSLWNRIINYFSGI